MSYSELGFTTVNTLRKRKVDTIKQAKQLSAKNSPKGERNTALEILV